MKPFLLLFFFFTQWVCAQDTALLPKDQESSFHSLKASHQIIPSEQQILPWSAQLGALYLGQWAYYVTLQNTNIRKNGSFKNWYTGPFNTHFDKDSYDYNLILHTVAGGIYYQYYRTFGHTRQGALASSILSVLLFEYTIETITEPPSLQDIYQTPILGAILGIGLEEASLALHSTNSITLKIIGSLLNPFTLIPGEAWKIHWAPILTGQNKGGIAYVSF